MKLSPSERWILSNQLRILEALYPEDADSFAVQREAIEQGYEFVYDINSPINLDTMCIDDSQEVWDTLDMFLAIDSSIRMLETDAFKDHRQRKFRGYDGNEETKFMAFTHYTVERLERWAHLPLKEPGHFNSHRRMRDTYAKMIKTWKGFDSERFNMNLKQLKLVLDSANS